MRFGVVVNEVNGLLRNPYEIADVLEIIAHQLRGPMTDEITEPFAPDFEGSVYWGYYTPLLNPSENPLP